MLRCLVYTRTSHKLRFPDPSNPPAPPRRWEKKKIGFRKWSPEWVFFENAGLSFSNTIMSYIIQRMPCEGCCRISIFLAFRCGREKAIQVKPRAIWSNKLLVDSYFCENKGKKFSVLKNMGTHSLPRRVRHAFLPHAWRTPKNVCVGG